MSDMPAADGRLPKLSKNLERRLVITLGHAHVNHDALTFNDNAFFKVAQRIQKTMAAREVADMSAANLQSLDDKVYQSSCAVLRQKGVTCVTLVSAVDAQMPMINLQQTHGCSIARAVTAQRVTDTPSTMLPSAMLPAHLLAPPIAFAMPLVNKLQLIAGELGANFESLSVAGAVAAASAAIGEHWQPAGQTLAEHVDALMAELGIAVVAQMPLPPPLAQPSATPFALLPAQAW